MTIKPEALFLRAFFMPPDRRICRGSGPMAFYGPLWPSMALYGLLCLRTGGSAGDPALWPSMAFYGLLWPSMAFYASGPEDLQGIRPYGLLWPSMAFYGPLWPSMPPDRRICRGSGPMAFYGPLWPSMALYGLLCLRTGGSAGDPALWPSMALYGLLCLRTGRSAGDPALWPSMAFYGLLWPSMALYSLILWRLESGFIPDFFYYYRDFVISRYVSQTFHKRFTLLQFALNINLWINKCISQNRKT